MLSNLSKLLVFTLIVGLSGVSDAETTKTPSSGAASPIKYLLNSVLTSVSEDTGTPANSTPLPVHVLGTVSLVYDTNFGTVGANTLRTAAQVGNATGAANFGAGATGAQTLRVEANQGAAVAAASGWPVKPTDGTNSQGYTASSEAKVSVTQALPAGANTIGKVDQGTGGASAWKVDGSAVTQPISASALPLPTGASTSAKQPALGTAGTASADVVSVQGIASMTPLSVSAASLPLPTGAATETTLSTLNGKVPSNLTVTSTRLLVDGSGVTQPVSAASLPLPSGAATSANQSTEITSLSSIDGKLTAGVPTLNLSTALTTASASSLNADVIPVFDTTGYSAFTVQLTGTWVGTVTFQGSDDNVTFYTTTMQSLQSGAVSPTTTRTVPDLVMWPVQAKYMRARVTAYTSGTVTASAYAFSTPINDMGLRFANSAQSGTWTVQPGNTQNTTAWRTIPDGGATGSSPGTTTVSTVATITAPATALGFVLMATSDNTANIRYRIGATATTTSGQRLEPGRDTGYIPCSANVSIVAESGTQNYDIQWVTR